MPTTIAAAADASSAAAAVEAPAARARANAATNVSPAPAEREVAGVAEECDRVAIRAQHRVERPTIAAAGAGGVDADQSGGAGFQVTHEHVTGVVIVVGNQVAGVAFEGHVAPVVADV